jgi:hypothetical protein
LFIDNKIVVGQFLLLLSINKGIKLTYDYTVILSESAESLQEAISAFEEYCNIWKLTVNTKKTKIVVFSKKKYKTNVVFKIYGLAIDLQDSYSYLGVIFNIIKD